MILEMEKKSLGRLKVEMVKMKIDSNLQVTYSKRRSGVFKEASELCTLWCCNWHHCLLTRQEGGEPIRHPIIRAIQILRTLISYYNGHSKANQQQKNKNSNTTKATRGRQKIQIKKLEDESSRQVIFSKRRNGLFKKASALFVLWGANIGIIVFSPKGKPFRFGHPNVDTILNRYLSGNSTLHDQDADSATTGTTPCFEEFNEECQEALEKLKEEKKRTKEIEEEKEERKSKGEFWWDEPIDNLG
ncbi:hypothetical protein CRYUN_Cryun10bG0160200 [Craigia yunnanensis]